MHLAPLIPHFTAAYPDIQVRLNLADQLHDLIKEGHDLAIRVADLKDSTAIVRKLADNRRFLCAAPAYLEQHGTPERPEDLLDHACLLLRFPGSQQFRWVLGSETGPMTINVSGAMDSDNGEAVRDWCLAGHGIALLSVYEAGHDLKDGRLKVVLPDHPPPGHGVYALYPHGRYVPPRVRAFIDFLAKAYGPSPPWLKGLPRNLRT
jgi:DNA-binding transcriptional LysR family regulator